MKFSFTVSLQKWYDIYKRPLPWRDISDPYLIWLSEIILQQTRVNQGLPYYYRFVERFPTVHDLAKSSEDEVLQLWQGLGYYSRGRNLLKCAKKVVDTYGGKFPDTLNEITTLPGIGDYTGSAILSFAYNKRHAVLDGNVYRVLSRLFGISTPINSPIAIKEFKSLAEQLLDKQNPAEHNQAMMEFGALQCVPKNPVCTNCIFQDSCVALRTSQVAALPIKTKAKPKRIRHFNYIIFLRDQQTIIQKRSGKGIWQGLFEFPLIETEHKVTTEVIFEHIFKQFGIEPNDVLSGESIKHLLTHQTIYADFWVLPVPDFNFNRNSDTFEVDLQALGTDFAIPVLLNKFLESPLMNDLCQ